MGACAKYTCVAEYQLCDEAPVCQDIVGRAVSRCPYLQHVSQTHGTTFARSVALNPLVALQNEEREVCRGTHAPTGRVGSRHEPLFPEDDFGSLEAVMSLVHGPGGCVPLAREDTKDVDMPMMGSISLSGFGNLPHMAAAMMRKLRQQKRTSQQKKHQQMRRNPTKGGAAPGSQVSTTPKAPAGNVPVSRDNSMGRFLRNPMGGIIALGAGKSLQCPPAIVSMRAAVARLKAVQNVRPYALPIRALALAGAAISCNIPCGMLREHTKKFSPAWIVAVHATIPFVAMLRKAVMMPWWGLGLTVLGSLAGQQLGSTLERKRLRGSLPLMIGITCQRSDISRMPRAFVESLLPEGHQQIPVY